MIFSGQLLFAGREDDGGSNQAPRNTALNLIETENAASAPHPLDQVIWTALTTSHRDLALGSARARYYPPSVAPFAALLEPTERCFAELAGALESESDAGVTMFTLLPLPDQPWFDVVMIRSMDQMLGPDREIEVAGTAPSELSAKDADRIFELVEIAKPGPFRLNTRSLGRFVGYREGDCLLAMSGERMRLTGFTEISAVCTHPLARGRGLAYRTVASIANGILRRGETPFLHVFSDNQSAIALYRKLGFARRAQLVVTVLRRNASPVPR